MTQCGIFSNGVWWSDHAYFRADGYLLSLSLLTTYDVYTFCLVF